MGGSNRGFWIETEMNRGTARLLFAALAAAALLVIATPSPASADRYRKIRCHPAKHLVTAKLRGFHRRFRLRHLVTVRANKRVWTARNGSGDFGTSYFACWRPTGHGHLLGINSGGAAVTDAFLSDFALAGRYVAFHLPGRGDENYDRFRSVDVRTGRVLRDSGKIETSRESSIESELVVTRAGAIAWLQNGVLQAIDAAGTRTLATAAGGTITALGVHGATLDWTQGGARYSATLR
jgi:hypothetical protein